MEKFFDEVFTKLDMKISVKTRIGIFDESEFPEIMEVYNKFPFEEVIVHPRTRVQLYNGLPNMESFDYAYKVSKNKLCYNGNVFSVEDYNDIVSNYDVDSVMLGRGLLRNPNLVNEIKGGEKKVLVIVNPLDEKFTDQTAQTVMGETMTLTEKEIKTVSSEGKFMMTNVNRASDTDGMVSVTVDGTETNPTNVTVEVERVVAKIEDMTTNYEIEVKDNSNNDVVVFQKVALINGNTKFYPIMKVKDNVEDDANDYVQDPNFEGQSDQTVADFYSKEFTAKTFDNVGDNVKALSSEENAANALFYTLENTMTANEQMNAYTTGLYYQAQYKLGGQEGNVYKFGENLYTWSQLSSNAGSLGLNLTNVINLL